jgi:hypothetical protein
MQPFRPNGSMPPGIVYPPAVKELLMKLPPPRNFVEERSVTILCLFATSPAEIERNRDSMRSFDCGGVALTQASQFVLQKLHQADAKLMQS